MNHGESKTIVFLYNNMVNKGLSDLLHDHRDGNIIKVNTKNCFWYDLMWMSITLLVNDVVILHNTIQHLEAICYLKPWWLHRSIPYYRQRILIRFGVGYKTVSLWRRHYVIRFHEVWNFDSYSGEVSSSEFQMINHYCFKQRLAAFTRTNHGPVHWNIHASI